MLGANRQPAGYSASARSASKRASVRSGAASAGRPPSKESSGSARFSSVLHSACSRTVRSTGPRKPASPSRRSSCTAPSAANRSPS